MGVQGTQIALASSSAQAIATASNGVLRVTVRNAGTGVAYLGSSGATATAFQLSSADVPLPITLTVGDVLYGYSTGTPTLHVLRTGDTT